MKHDNSNINNDTNNNSTNSMNILISNRNGEGLS